MPSVLRFCSLFVAACFTFFVVAAEQQAGEALPVAALASSFRIAGYVPDYRFGGINLNHTVDLVDDLYLFSLMPQTQLGAQMFKVCCLQPGYYEQARQAVAHARDTLGKEVKLWVTVGGAGRSHKMTSNPSAMIGALRELLATEQLKGVDYNCEEFRSHKDYESYEVLIRNSAKVLHKTGAQISVALHVGQTFPEEIYEVIDRINLMTYDMHGATYHADFGKAQAAVTALIASGCPAEKIFLGIPAYGRHKRNPSDTKTYAELVDKALESSVEASSEAMYGMSDYLVESPKAVAKKVKYAVEAGLGGVFFWELGQDKQSPAAPGGILLQAAASAKRQYTTSDGSATSPKETISSDDVDAANEEL